MTTRQNGILLTREQLREWAGLGRDLTDDELDELDDCIPNSSIPDAIETIVTEAMNLAGEDEDEGPVESDGYVTLDPGPGSRIGYQVRLSGVDKGTFPAQGIAVYELARAMAESGEFPSVWMAGEHGPSVRPIEDEVRAYHDAGGTGLLPLAGTRYGKGNLILLNDDTLPYEVDCDYGTLGVMAHTAGDPSVTVIAMHDRLTPYPENCASCGLPVIRRPAVALEAPGLWEDPDYAAGSDEARHCDASPDFLHHPES
jgi:hypothetical protein